MNKTMGSIKKWIIVISILLLIGIILVVSLKLFKSFSIISDKSNIQIDKEIEGDYTGYRLTLKAHYGGYGEAGQDLGSGTIVKMYNISDNDTFFEPFMGGIWKINLEKSQDTSNSLSSEILKINKIEEETIQLEFEKKEYIARYDEEINIPSNGYTYDGVNYSYIIKISQEK